MSTQSFTKEKGQAYEFWIGEKSIQRFFLSNLKTLIWQNGSPEASLVDRKKWAADLE